MLNQIIKEASSLEIKDLAGLSEPVTKLIEEVSKGIGGVYKPLGTVLNTKAEAYRIKKMTEAKSYQIKMLKENLTDEKNELVITIEDFEIKLKGNSIETRAIETMVHKEVQKQINLENIISKSIEFIRGNSIVTEEPVDTDWMTRFINISQDISNEEMQILWSKILSDEVVKPNSYSLRTLEVLRNLSSNEAKLFSRFVNLSVKISGSFRVINDDKYLSENNISLEDINLLKELNLINTDLSYSIHPGEKLIIPYYDKVMFVNNGTQNDLSFNIISLTRIGNEIHNLIDKDYRVSILENIGKAIKSKCARDINDIEVAYVDVTWKDDINFSYVEQNKVIIQ